MWVSMIQNRLLGTSIFTERGNKIFQIANTDIQIRPKSIRYTKERRHDEKIETVEKKRYSKAKMTKTAQKYEKTLGKSVRNSTFEKK